MSEDFLRNRLYQYSANSNLVLEAERDRRRPDEAKSEVESLRNIVGSIRMGERAKSSRPDISTNESSAKRRRVDDDANFAKPASRKGPSITKGSNVLNVADEIDSNAYHPKSTETKSAFEEFTGEVHRLLGDQPQDVLRGATFELLEIFKDNSIADYRKIEEASKLMRINRDTFAKLLQLSNRLTDYATNDQTNKTEGEEITEDMAVVFDDDDEDGGDGDRFDSDDSDNDDSDNDEKSRDHGDRENDENNYHNDENADHGLHTNGKSKRSADDLTAKKSDGGLSVHDIDAYWLQRQISKIVTDANQAAKLAEEALLILFNDDDRIVENRLVSLLDYDNFELVKLLVTNKQKIYYTTKIKQAQSETEKKALENTLANDAMGRLLLEELQGKTSAQDFSRNRTAKGLQDGVSRSTASAAAVADNDQMDVDESSAPASALKGFGSTFKLTGAPTLRLEDLAFQGSNHFMANERCQLPEKSWRVQKKGYEEIHVPALKAPVVNTEHLKAIADLPEWMHACFDGVKHLNRVQSKLCDFAVEDAGNMLLCAPTGSGKTNVALLCMLGMINRYRNAEDGSIKLSEFKIVYVAPMKALVHECVQNFSKRLAPLNITVKELSGDQSLTALEIANTQIIVTTPEKWDVITRKAGDRAYLQFVRMMIVDEIHLLHDERGAVLESIIGRAIRTCEETKDAIRMVGLSATLPNYEDVAAFMRVEVGKGLFFFDNSFRPVPLQQQFIGITEKKSLKRVQLMNEICYEKCLLHAGKNQMLIFTHSRADTMKTARALVEMCQANETLNKFIREGSASSEILRAEALNAKHPELQELIKYGFAFHHAGLSRADRTLVEDLFADKHIQVLVSTATLAWGVNLPVHTVIIKGTQVYSPEQGRWTELSALDILQMMGRAGRYGLDSEGEGIILTQHSELQYYLSLMNQQLPIESHLVKRLAESLNAEIVLGSITSLKDAVAWMGYTYLYVRMIRNPRLYQVPLDAVEADPYLQHRRLELVYAAVSTLEKRGMVQFNRANGHIVSNYVGRVASYYYVTHETMETYVKHLRPNMHDIELFRLISQSSEFANMYVRPEEKLELNKLVQRVPIPIKESVEEPACKINVLLQAYISKLKLEGFALSADMTFIQQSAARLFRCLFELAWKKRWASVAVKLLELAVMVDRKLWRSQSPLRQFTAIPEILIRKLERISDIPWEKYYDLTPQDFGEMVKMPKMGKTLHKFVHMIPRLHIDLRAYPLARSLLRLDIECTPDFEFQESVHGRSVVFWLMIEDGDGQQLLHTEPITLYATKNASRTSCTIPLVEPLPPQYFLRVIADRWLHAHQIIPISFKHLILPEKFPLPTPVLDLKPVTTTLIADKRVRAFLEAEHLQTLNSLQTQTYHALFEQDSNVLVCAPSGAGKQTCIDLALLRYITAHYQQHSEEDHTPFPRKALYISPHQDWCVSLCRSWAPKLAELFPGLTLVLLTGETMLDYDAMKQADVIVSTPEHWNLMNTKWKQRKFVQQIGLYLFDSVHLIASSGVLAGDVSAAAYEMVISRARFIATTVYQQMVEDAKERRENNNNDEDSEDESEKQWRFPARFVACGYAAANAKDIGEWLGVTSQNNFYFAPQQSPGTVSMSFHASDHHDQAVRISSLSKHMFSSIGSVYRNFMNSNSGTSTSTSSAPTTVVFVPNRKLARLTAIDIVSFANNRRLSFTSHQQQQQNQDNTDSSSDVTVVSFPKEYRQKIAQHVQDMALKEVLQYGVGYHYEGQPLAEQVCVQELFEMGYVTVMIVPFRLAYQCQVNVPHVYLLDTQYFDGKLGVEVDMDALEMGHMIGRARHSSVRGHVTVYCPASKRDHLERSLTQLMPVESRLHTQMTDPLLAEMVAKTIETKADSVDFLTWTFLYRRLPKNPNFYGLLGTSVRHISDYLSELIEENITDMAENKFVAVEDNELDVSPLNLGMISAYYGITTDTIAIVANSLTAKSRIKAMLEVLSCAMEWEESVPIRAQEWHVLATLARQIAVFASSNTKSSAKNNTLSSNSSSSSNSNNNNNSLSVEANQLLVRLLGQEKNSEDMLSDTARKVLIVLYCQQRRISLPYELMYDLTQILRHVSKMLYATVDVLASQGWLKASLAAMELHQCLIQGVHETDSTLLQLPHLNNNNNNTAVDHVRRLREDYQVESIVDFLQLDDEPRQSFLAQHFSTSQISDIAKFCNSYPSIELAFDLPGLTQISGEDDDEENAEMIYSVKIEEQTTVKIVAMVARDNIDEDDDDSNSSNNNNIGKVVSQRYPVGNKREEWWLLVGDASQNILYGIKRFALAKRAQVKLEFELPNDLSSVDAMHLKLYLMCDSYLGCDQEYDFTLRLD